MEHAQTHFPWGGAHEKGIEDSVLVGLVINADGRPDPGSFSIVRHGASQLREDYDSAALHWARGLIFWPACKGDEPVRVRTAVPIRWEWPWRHK